MNNNNFYNKQDNDLMLISDILSQLSNDAKNIKVNNIDIKIKKITTECLKINKADTIQNNEYFLNNFLSFLFLKKQEVFSFSFVIVLVLVCFVFLSYKVPVSQKQLITSRDITDKSNIASNNISRDVLPVAVHNKEGYKLVSTKGILKITGKTSFSIKEKEKVALEQKVSLSTSIDARCRLSSSFFDININENSLVEVDGNNINIKAGHLFFNFNENLKKNKVSFTKPAFVIHTPDITINVIGTIFSVYTSRNNTTVKLMHGKVKIEANDKSLNYMRYLKAGENFKSDANKFTITNDKNVSLDSFIVQSPGTNATELPTTDLNINDYNINQLHEQSDVSKTIDLENAQTIETNIVKLSSDFMEETKWLNSIKTIDPVYYEKLINMADDDRKQIYLNNKKATDLLNNLK